MNKDKKIGKCHLCGKVTKLTFEHVPPRKAFNSHPVFLRYGLDMIGKDSFPWDFSEGVGEFYPRGIGGYTLCGKCNNNTGSWYGSDFVEFIYQGYRNYIALMKGNKLFNKNIVKMQFIKVYPLRIIKQVITMFFSVNSPGLSSAHPELRAFVLDKNKQGISSSEFGIYLYVLVGSVIRYAGVTGIIHINRGITRILSELSAPPFGFVLEFNPKVEEHCNIVFFANNYKYNQKVDLSLEIPVYESHTPYPADFRTKKEVLEAYIKNKLWEIKQKRKSPG